MKTFLKMWLGNKKACLMLVAGLLLTTIGNILNAQVIFTITEAFNDVSSMSEYAMRILVICVFAAATNISGRYCCKMSSALCYTEVDKELSAKITKVEYSTYVALSCDKIITMASHLPDVVNIVPTCVNIISNVIFIVITLVYIAFIDKSIVIPIIILYSSFFIVFYLMNSKFVKIRNEKREAIHKRDGERNEVINGFAEVRAFATEIMHCNSLWESTQKVTNLVQSTQLSISVLIMLIELADTIAIYLAIGCAVKGFTQGYMTAASSLLLVNYVWRLSTPIDVSIELITVIHECMTFVNEYNKFMETSDSKDGNIELNSFDSNITIKDLSFKYDKSENVLYNVNLSIKKGEHIGICGTSGGGKSTLLKIMARFYNDYSGCSTCW